MVLIFKSCVFSWLCLLAAVRGALVQVTNFGSNPAELEMYIDLPENVTANAPVILAVSSSYNWYDRVFLLIVKFVLASWMWRIGTEILRTERSRGRGQVQRRHHDLPICHG